MTREDIVKRFLKNGIAEEVGFNNSNSMVVNFCLDEWQRPHRFYHGFNHLSKLMEQIGSATPPWSRYNFTKRDLDMMELLALCHDVICVPGKNDNEEKSIEFIERFSNIFNRTAGAEEYLKEIFDGIRWTQYEKDQNFNHDKNCPDYVRLFCSLDIGLECQSSDGDNLTSVTRREIQLFKEFQHWDFSIYRQERLDFIDKFKYFSKFFKNQATEFLCDYRPKIGVYPGSFNPFHVGHLNILEQAEKIFDKVIVAIGIDPSKANNDVSAWTPEKILPFHQVVRYNGLLSEYLKSINYADVTVIRGLRSGYDLDHEMTQLRILEDYGCKLPVAYFLCSKETTHISSSMVRGMLCFENSAIEKYIPKKYRYAV